MRPTGTSLGGASWPVLGSNGAWVSILADRGVTITPLQAANCGFDVAWSEHLKSRFAGAPIKPVAITWTEQAGTQVHRQGEFVLTETGIEGSLVYAAVLLRPQEAFFTDPAWPDAEGGWQAELAPHYATAERMLGLATNPYPGLQDEWLRETARRMGAEPSFGPVPQGIFFGAPGRAHADPFFAGQGPARKGCERCGRCITGCAVGAKNSLDKNYLHLAEKAGVAVRVECQVTHLEKLPGEGYRLHLRHPWQRSVSLPPIRARRVVLSAGVLGTLDILFASRDR